MNVTATLSTEGDAHIVKNLYPLYLHDLSEFSGERPNEHGILEPGLVATLSAQNDVHDVWWRMPNVLFPFIVRVDGGVAGFAFVARPPHVPESIDHSLHEFFIARAFRGMGVGRQAATEILNRFRGRWQLEVLAKNLAARAFWRTTLRQYTGNQFEERSAQTDDGPRHIFRFDNSPIDP